LLDHEVDQRPERWEIARDFDWEDLLREICRLHAIVRAHYGELPKYVMTLHHLDRLIVWVLVNGELGVSRFLTSSYFQYLRGDAAAETTFRQCLVAASPFWGRALDEFDADAD
jgi:hypothetical protein